MLQLFAVIKFSYFFNPYGVIVFILPQRFYSFLTGFYSKHETKSKAPSMASKKPVSGEAIRRSVRDSLKEILTQRSMFYDDMYLNKAHSFLILVLFEMLCFHFRLKDSDLNISVERASDVAKKTERELFHLYKDTDHKYKSKYRSLMFNLKDTKNNVSTFLIIR